ncbi:hypothetical protein GTA08_BOTSDO07287 [Botryosphaeria dothidea]|uniref:Uncharacterized protein n=1 Tax=Botryosphaeria dothidea TaxID=55169 RepID=A0A8H4II91_9PEZI|nr:hypothetical protein GTA08_BOTSDO11479 [Botryosphaeria dothidea]KAF4305594.1 hypothetical protein GTA08_BOTSDO07287 [Botryosphaeria dothidea]
MSDYTKNQMDGDQSAKAMEAGASSATKNLDFTEGIHEDSKPRTEPAGLKTSGAGTSVFDSDGVIGKQFTTKGAIGGAAQNVGGPFDAQGSIGKQFTDKGSIGGTVQEHLGQGESNSIRK